jgi:uncharacterized protein (DUF2267 family)
MRELVDGVVRGGLVDEENAKAALRATLAAVAERMTDDERALLAGMLPEDLTAALARRRRGMNGDSAALYERVRRLEHTTASAAREHAQIVLRVFGSLIAEEQRVRLERALPRDVVHLLRREASEPPPPHPDSRQSTPMNTLAAGRPGSTHPVSTGRPPAGQTHSVVENADPHGETKLSSAHGLTQERFRESLATGRPPGPSRPLDEATDHHAGEEHK